MLGKRAACLTRPSHWRSHPAPTAPGLTQRSAQAHNRAKEGHEYREERDDDDNQGAEPQAQRQALRRTAKAQMRHGRASCLPAPLLPQASAQLPPLPPAAAPAPTRFQRGLRGQASILASKNMSVGWMQICIGGEGRGMWAPAQAHMPCRAACRRAGGQPCACELQQRQRRAARRRAASALLPRWHRPPALMRAAHLASHLIGGAQVCHHHGICKIDQPCRARKCRHDGAWGQKAGRQGGVAAAGLDGAARVPRPDARRAPTAPFPACRRQQPWRACAPGTELPKAA